MKFTYSWLKDYVPIEMPVAELVEVLTKHGVKVESHESQGNDTLITLEITANRPDCLSLHGIAREVALLTGQKVHPKEPDLSDIKEKKSLTGNFITVNNSELCPIYIGRIIKGVKVRPSPDWLRKRVESIGLRSINNVVDITNFVLFETGQPLHAFDYNALTDNKIIVRLANQGEKIMAIDGKEYQLTKDTLVIADGRKPVAIAGIMGGKQTEVTEPTTDVLLESAYFQPASIRKSGRYLKLSSDSSYRFERGVAPAGVLTASDRALELILAAAGGKLVGHQEVNYSSAVRVTRCQSGDELQPTIVGSNSLPLKLPHYYKAKPKNVTLRLARLEQVLGVSIETATVKRILKGLGFVLKKEWKGQIDMDAPDFRPDINLEVDIIEEIVRVIGYDSIPPVAPVIEMKAKTPDKLNNVIQSTRHILYGLGYNEVLGDSLCASQSNENLIGLLDTENNVSKYLRSNLIDGLKQIYTLNENYQKGNVIKLFEISKVYYREKGVPSEQLKLAVLDSAGFAALKGTLTALFNNLELNYSFKDNGIIVNGKDIGNIKLQKPVTAVCELNFEEIVKHAKLDKRYQEFSRMPAISRDIAVVIDEGDEWSDIEKTVRQTLEPTRQELPVESVEFFDVYHGKQIPAGKKSVAFSITFRHPSQTLSAAKADEVIKSVHKALQDKLGATIR